MCFREGIYSLLLYLNHSALLAILLLLCRLNVRLLFGNVFSEHMWKDSIGWSVWLIVFPSVPNAICKYFLLFTYLCYNEEHNVWHLLKQLWKIFDKRMFIMTRLSGIISQFIYIVNHRERTMNPTHTLKFSIVLSSFQL